MSSAQQQRLAGAMPDERESAGHHGADVGSHIARAGHDGGMHRRRRLGVLLQLRSERDAVRPHRRRRDEGRPKLAAPRGRRPSQRLRGRRLCGVDTLRGDSDRLVVGARLHHCVAADDRPQPRQPEVRLGPRRGRADLATRRRRRFDGRRHIGRQCEPCGRAAPHRGWCRLLSEPKQGHHLRPPMRGRRHGRDVPAVHSPLAPQSQLGPAPDQPHQANVP